MRLPPRQMPEGRIQMLTHHTEDAMWQPRWLDHHNGVVSLQAVLIVVGDPREAAERFGRFAGRDCERRGPGQWHLPLDRGRIVFTDGGRNWQFVAMLQPRNPASILRPIFAAGPSTSA